MKSPTTDREPEPGAQTELSATGRARPTTGSVGPDG